MTLKRLETHSFLPNSLLRALFAGMIAMRAVTPAMADLPPKDRVPFPDAQKKALLVARGKLESASLEQIEGAWRYLFEIRDPKGQVHKVLIDAISGEVVPIAAGSVIHGD